MQVRSVVVALRDGGLWVHNPVAPTAELLEMVAELEARHGAVRYVVLGSTQVEHKVFLGPFARRFPDAEVPSPSPPPPPPPILAAPSITMINIAKSLLRVGFCPT